MKLIHFLILFILILNSCQKNHSYSSSSQPEGNEIGFGGYGFLNNDDSIEILDLMVSPLSKEDENIPSDPELEAKLLRALNIENNSKVNRDFIKVFVQKLKELDRLYLSSPIDVDKRLVGAQRSQSFSQLLLSVIAEDFRWVFVPNDVIGANDVNPNLRVKIEHTLGFKLPSNKLLPLAYRRENKIIASLSRFNQLKNAQHRAALIYHESFSSIAELLARRTSSNLTDKQRQEISLKAVDLVSYIFSNELLNKGSNGFLNNFWLVLVGQNSNAAILKRDSKLQSLQGQMLLLDEGAGFDFRLHSPVIPFEIALPTKTENPERNTFSEHIDGLPKSDPCHVLGKNWFLPSDTLMHRLVLHKYFDLKPKDFGSRVKLSFSPFLLLQSQEDTSDHNADFTKTIDVEKNWNALMFNSASLNVLPLRSRGKRIVINTPRSYWNDPKISDEEAALTGLIQARRIFHLMCARYEPQNGLTVIKDHEGRSWKFLGEFRASDKGSDRCNLIMGKDWRLPTPKEYFAMKNTIVTSWSDKEAPPVAYMSQSTSSQENRMTEQTHIDWGMESEHVALRSEESLKKDWESVHEMYVAIAGMAFKYQTVRDSYIAPRDTRPPANLPHIKKVITAPPKAPPSMLHICVNSES